VQGGATKCGPATPSRSARWRLDEGDRDRL
jgi:hypothetical protein